jgi:hypothetical protein
MTRIGSNNLRGISFLSLALQQSLTEFAQTLTFEERGTTDVQFINDAGDIYLPYYSKIGPIEDGEDKIPLFLPKGNTDARFGNLVSFPNFRNDYIKDQVTTINFDENFSLTSLLKQLSENKAIYGVVLQSGTGRNSFAMNPLHPMVAFMVVSGLYKMPTSGKLHIFELTELGQTKMNQESAEKNQKIDSYVADYQKFFSLTPKLVRNPVIIRQSATITDSSLDTIAGGPFIESIQELQVTVEKKSEEEGGIDKIQSIIIPTQLIVDSTFAPYYGVANVTSPTNGRLSGCSLSPMATGNINRNRNTGDKYLGSIGHEGNVCAGSESPSTPKGWFTLSRVNLNSLHYHDILDEIEVFPWIEASKKISRGIWAVEEEKEQTASSEEASDAEPVADPA